MDKKTGLLIICGNMPNGTGADSFNVAPGITVECVRDISEFLAPHTNEIKYFLGTKRWETHIDPPGCERKWVVIIDGTKTNNDVAPLTFPSRFWKAFKIASSFRCSVSAYSLCCRSEGHGYHPCESWMEEGWFDTESTGDNASPMTKEIFDRWMDFAAKLHPLYRDKEASERSDRFTTGVALFCRGLQEHDIRHRLNCFILALEALICSPEARQKEYFLTRIKCFWPENQPKLLSPKRAAEIINNIFFLKLRLEHLKDLSDGETIWKSYWWIVLQAEQLARSAYAAILSSPEHYSCFTDIQRQQAFWASRSTRILFQTSPPQC